MKLLTKTILILLMTFSASVFAGALTAPKSGGIIGERFDGYVGIVKNASPKIKALVKSVNQKRKAKYKEVAIKRQQPLKQVEMIAGKAAIKRTKLGNFILLEGKGWKKK